MPSFLTHEGGVIPPQVHACTTHQTHVENNKDSYQLRTQEKRAMEGDLQTGHYPRPESSITPVFDKPVQIKSIKVSQSQRLTLLLKKRERK